MVSNDKYFESISEDILKICGDQYLICSWSQGIRFCYNSLINMLLTDNSVRYKLFNSRMTRKTYEIINDFKEIIENIEPGKGWRKQVFIYIW